MAIVLDGQRISNTKMLIPKNLGGYSVGVLVQSNFGGVLQILGLPVGRSLDRYYLKDALDSGDAGGSILIVVATDAPLSDRNLSRLARRALFGLARTGASFANGSGDYAIAFSVAEDVRRTSERRRALSCMAELPNERVSPLFQAAIEAAEEAIFNSLFKATTVIGHNGFVGEALPLDRLMDLIDGGCGKRLE